MPHKNAIIGQWNLAKNSRILRNTDLHWCSDITSQYLGTSFQHFVCLRYWLHMLHVFLPVSSDFFQFFPVSSGKNWKKYPFFPVSSITPIKRPYYRDDIHWWKHQRCLRSLISSFYDEYYIDYSVYKVDTF